MGKAEVTQTTVRRTILDLAEAMPVLSPEDDSTKQSLMSRLTDLFYSSVERKPVVLYREYSSGNPDDPTFRCLSNRIVDVLCPKLWLKKPHNDTQRGDVEYHIFQTSLPDIVLVEEIQWSETDRAASISILSLQGRECWELSVRPDGVVEAEGLT